MLTTDLKFKKLLSFCHSILNHDATSPLYITINFAKCPCQHELKKLSDAIQESVGKASGTNRTAQHNVFKLNESNSDKDNKTHTKTTNSLSTQDKATSKWKRGASDITDHTRIQTKNQLTKQDKDIVLKFTTRRKKKHRLARGSTISYAVDLSSVQEIYPKFFSYITKLKALYYDFILHHAQKQ